MLVTLPLAVSLTVVMASDIEIKGPTIDGDGSTSDHGV